jgi:hypothetical protein
MVFTVTNTGGMPAFQYYFEQTSTVLFDPIIHAIDCFWFFILSVRAVLVDDFSDAKKIILVCDNLNTHSHGAFYEMFGRSHARSLVRRLGIVHTPKHGSWLSIAKNELSVLTRQCVYQRRFGILKQLRENVEACNGM